MPSRIKNKSKAKQLVDFDGLNLDGYIYPTDIDGVFDYKGDEFIFFEIKYRDTPMSVGQRLAYQHLVDCLLDGDYKAVTVVCEHTVKNADEPVKAADCRVREIYCGNKWTRLNQYITTKNFVDKFHRLNKEDI